MGDTKSVFQLINDLVLNLEKRCTHKSKLCLVSTVYANLLNPKTDRLLLNANSQHCNMLICYLRLVLAKNALADYLESLFDSLKSESKFSSENVENILKFLCCLNRIPENSVAHPHFAMEPFSIIRPKRTTSVFNVEEYILPKQVLAFENLPISTTNFPLLPSSCKERKENDEGYVEGCSNNLVIFCPQNDSPCDLTKKIDFWTDPAVLNGVSNRIEKPQNIFLSEAADDIFQEIFYSQQNLREQPEVIRPLTFACFKRHVKNLLFGIESDLFFQDKLSNQFYTKRAYSLTGLSVECLHSSLLPLITAGNEIFYISNFLNNECLNKNLPIVRRLFVSLRRNMQIFEDNVDSICNECNGALEVVEKLKPHCEHIKCIYELLLALDDKQKKSSENTTWLIDKVFGLSASFYYSSAHNEFFQTISRRLVSTYFSYIDNWLRFGNCFSSGNSDFFVNINENFYQCRDRKFWNFAFSFVERRVPSIFQRWATKIFNAGKLTNLLMLCKKTNATASLSDNENLDFIFKPSTFSLMKIQQEIDTADCGDSANDTDNDSGIFSAYFDFTNSCQFQEFLNEILSKRILAIEQTAVDCMLNAFKLNDIFNILRQLYMGANGFFMISIAETLFPLFHENIYSPVSTDLLSPLLTRALDDCLDTSRVDKRLFVTIGLHISSLVNSVENCANASDVHFSNLNFFDTLNLHCEIPWPCNIVVTDSILNWCKRIFRFLLILRWTICALNEVWNYLKSPISDTCFLNRHKLMLCQREMVHFVRQLETYILHQTVDVCWADFSSSYRSSPDFESIVNLHNQYMNNVVARCLLNPKAQRLYEHIRRLLECCLMFRCRVIDDENETKACLAYDQFKIRAQALITVVEKLATRGYQRHLNELLLWLNFNEFYFKMPNSD